MKLQKLRKREDREKKEKKYLLNQFIEQGLSYKAFLFPQFSKTCVTSTQVYYLRLGRQRQEGERDREG